MQVQKILSEIIKKEPLCEILNVLIFEDNKTRIFNNNHQQRITVMHVNRIFNEIFKIDSK